MGGVFYMSQNNNQPESPTIFIILGWLSTAIATLYFPIVFGTGGIIFGYLIRNKGEQYKQHGTIMMIVAVAAIIFGSLLGLISGLVYY